MNRRLVIANVLFLCSIVGGCSESSPGGPGDGFAGTDIRLHDAGDGLKTDLTGDSGAGDGGQGSDGGPSDGGGGGTWQIVPATVKAGACCLDAVWGTSSTDVWAVGNGQILHYDGKAWMPTVLPSGNHQFTAVAGTSTGQVYAGGYQAVAQFVAPGWQLMQAAPSGVHGLWVDKLDRLWGVRANNSVSYFTRYNGAAWATETTLTGHFLALWGSSSTDVWAVSLAGAIAHSHGADFVAMTPAVSPQEKLYAIWGASSTDVWAGGEQQWSATSGGQGLLRHFNGTSWTGPIAFTPPFTVRGIWGTSSKNIWAVGDSKMILHFDGNTWSTVPGPSGIGSYDLKAVWGSSANDIWAVGGGSLTGSSAEGLILHYH
jgi:hypothetical protein